MQTTDQTTTAELAYLVSTSRAQRIPGDSRSLMTSSQPYAYKTPADVADAVWAIVDAMPGPDYQTMAETAGGALAELAQGVGCVIGPLKYGAGYLGITRSTLSITVQPIDRDALIKDIEARGLAWPSRTDHPWSLDTLVGAYNSRRQEPTAIPDA